MKIVLQKFIADSGYCSRRKAEELIKNNKILVNGEPAELGMKVFDTDLVRVEGKAIGRLKEKKYIALNKPAGYTCTNRKFRGEKNIFDLVDVPERLFVVGRLDKDSEGLVLLTNDGDLAQKISHPSFGHEKKYIVKISNSSPSGKQVKFWQSGQISNKIVENFLKGIDIGDGDGLVRAKKIKYLGNNRFEIVLTEGKKRQIRRMFKALGFEVEGLLRTEIGDIKLGDLRKGKWRKIKYKLDI